MQVRDNLKLQPVRETIFDLVGSIAVDEPRDFAVLREVAKRHLAGNNERDLRSSEGTKILKPESSLNDEK
jgi:hypothetical protein